jgi:hypothetical protein
MDEAAPQAAGLAETLARLLAGEFGEITADMLRTTFTSWRIAERDGRCLAMRGGEAKSAGAQSLIQPVVRALTLEGLAEQLSLQEQLRRMSNDELEDVWRNGFPAVEP